MTRPAARRLLLVLAVLLLVAGGLQLLVAPWLPGQASGRAFASGFIALVLASIPGIAYVITWDRR